MRQVYAVDGRPLTAPSERIGVVFQRPVLLPWRTVIDNCLLPADVSGGRRKRRELERRAREHLALLGLSGFEDKYPGELSGGMQQRVAIGRALLMGPSILLMDEPFGALDAMTREQLNLEMLRIRREYATTIVFVTHSIPEAVFLGDRVIVMGQRPGRIIADLAIDLPEDRSIAMMADVRFNAYNLEVRQALDQVPGGASPSVLVATGERH
jgi:NitT/TauT family transport system ATP-binding protein